MENNQIKNLSKIKLLVIDVDGTMTDGGIYYDDNGNELKKFCTRDAAGIFAARQAGIEIMVLTGRECPAVTRRMNELKVDFLVQNVKNKLKYLSGFLQDKNLKPEEIGYIGDDLNDLGGMKIAGFSACPADACEEVKMTCDYISGVTGGSGAVRDIIFHLLNLRNQWNAAVSKVYHLGV